MQKKDKLHSRVSPITWFDPVVRRPRLRAVVSGAGPLRLLGLVHCVARHHSGATRWEPWRKGRMLVMAGQMQAREQSPPKGSGHGPSEPRKIYIGGGKGRVGGECDFCSETAMM